MSSEPTETPPSAQITPTAERERITNLDTIRGVAVLGILAMNAVSYGLEPAAYFNLDAGGSDTWLDWVIGSIGEIFFDQKMMGLFSLLFGAGIVLFADRAAEKGRRASLLSLWRNSLLLGIGLLHTLLWDGDILVVYAICSPLLIALRNQRPRTLLILGTAIVLWSAVYAVIVQSTIPESGEGLGDFWFVDGSDMSDTVGLFLLTDFFFRGLGMMLIGVALYRLDILQGRRPAAFYKKLAVIGLAVGLPLTALGLGIQIADDFSPDTALLGLAPNTVATIPLALAFVGLITLWDKRARTALHVRIQAAGRMALTNYLTQTILGVLVLQVIFDSEDLTRSWIAVFVVAVWVLQLAWSKPWLDRFRYGPFEWAWRVATYRSWQPLRKRSQPEVETVT